MRNKKKDPAKRKQARRGTTPSRQASAPVKPPRFGSEEEEREFWATHDSVDYVDWGQSRSVTLPNLKPSTVSISLRLPESLLNELKLLANRRDVPYQSLLKVFLAERLDFERKRKAS